MKLSKQISNIDIFLNGAYPIYFRMINTLGRTTI